MEEKMCHTSLSAIGGTMEKSEKINYKPRVCPSPISSIVGTALNQMNLKRSSSAPMIHQLVSQAETRTNNSAAATPTSTLSHLESKDPTSCSDSESTSVNGFLASLSSRPRRFSASFSPASSPGPPGLAPSRVSQLRQENITDWESASEKEFHGNANIAQSWEDLSLDSMSMEITTRRPSFSQLTEQLWLSMPGSTSMSASSSPTASPRVMSRFSPSLSSPSPTRKSFTSRRSLSPIAIRPSVLAVGQGVKRKCDWDANQMDKMDCSPQPAKKAGGLLWDGSLQQYSVQHISTASNSMAINSTATLQNNVILNNGQPILSPDLQQQQQQQQVHSDSPTFLKKIDSPNSIETESSISSNGDSPFFRPVDSPLTSEDSPHPK